jgi:dipeptide/tripeptide permease
MKNSRLPLVQPAGRMRCRPITTVWSANSIYNWYKAALILLPLFGGFLGDRLFGRYWTIVGFTLPYVLGHILLGSSNRVELLIALAFVAGDSGVIKANIPPLLGQTYDLVRPGQKRLRSAAFMWFYWVVNAGALIATIAVPLVRPAHAAANCDTEDRFRAPRSRRHRVSSFARSS